MIFDKRIPDIRFDANLIQFEHIFFPSSYYFFSVCMRERFFFYCSYSNATHSCGTNDAQLFFHKVLISRYFNAFSNWKWHFFVRRFFQVVQNNNNNNKNLNYWDSTLPEAVEVAFFDTQRIEFVWAPHVTSTESSSIYFFFILSIFPFHDKCMQWTVPNIFHYFILLFSLHVCIYYCKVCCKSQYLFAIYFLTIHVKLPYIL